MTLYGTPHDRGAQPAARRRQDPTTSPGFGISAAADGKRYPYLFPIAATYWSQGAAAVQFVKDKLGGRPATARRSPIVYYDNPAGQEPMPVIEELQKMEGFELRTFAVPPPGVEVGAQVLDIAQRYRPDFVIAHLFGRSPSVGDQGASSARAIRCRRWWAWCGRPPRPTSRRPAAGPSPRAITRCSSPAPATTTRSASRSRRCTKRQGKAAAEVMEEHGLLQSRPVAGGDARRGDPPRGEANGGKQPTGDGCQEGIRADQGLHARRAGAAARDHAGGPRRRRLGADLQVKGGKFVKETDWFRAYRDMVVLRADSGTYRLTRRTRAPRSPCGASRSSKEPRDAGAEQHRSRL